VKRNDLEFHYSDIHAVVHGPIRCAPQSS